MGLAANTIPGAFEHPASIITATDNLVENAFTGTS